MVGEFLREVEGEATDAQEGLERRTVGEGVGVVHEGRPGCVVVGKEEEGKGEIISRGEAVPR